MKRLQLRVYKLLIIVSAAVVTFSLVLLHTVSYQESGLFSKILEPTLPLFQIEKFPGAPAFVKGLRPKSDGATERSSRFSDYRWQPVGDSLDTYVYSAYLDDLRSPPVLRVIAIIVDHLTDHNLTCLYYAKFPSGGNEQPYMSRRIEQLQYIPEPDWKYKYRGAFLHCPVSLDAAPPQAVSIVVEGSSRAPLNLLPVGWTRSGNPLRYGITRCIPALHSNFSHVTSLLEMFAFSQKFGGVHNVDHCNLVHWQVDSFSGIFELLTTVGRHSPPSADCSADVIPCAVMRIQEAVFVSLCDECSAVTSQDTVEVGAGVSRSSLCEVNHFILYVLNASESVSRALDLYRRRGLVEVYEWNLPVNTSHIHYYGQLANMQDCLYRSLHVSRYVLIGDVDELFVPHQGRQLLPMLWRHLHSSLECGALQFINVFFPCSCRTRTWTSLAGTSP
ncbi:hypothetical protein C0Q70_02967 [Pomacea canaliculata]|uniref:Glycosyltransferase family 92 protein n=1 Tax=Pomacea canaliculata TaxID=400727 RepID=A0A2T7PRJ3_POMCA|nr:hypothetical protein C0Q70_02967 [Pomacea canaliculata]